VCELDVSRIGLKALRRLTACPTVVCISSPAIT
jgi:hypothetical protein